MRLFDEKDRGFLGPANSSEHDYLYLDRSGRPAAGRVRQLLERPFARLDSAQQVAMRGRLMAEGYRAGSMELILDELLLRRGAQVQHEPPKAGTSKRPDFAVTLGDANFYLEAVLATEQTPEQVTAEKRLGVLRDLLNKMDLRDFFVEIEIEEVGPRQPSASTIISFLAGAVADLDPDNESAWLDEDGEYQPPSWPWASDGWSLIFRFHPKRADARGKPNVRPVGMINPGVRQIDNATAIRGAVKKKATKYREMDRPYVIAVNVLSRHLDESDMMDALFGNRVYVARETTTGIKSNWERDPNGMWRGAAGKPRNTRVSAALFFENLDPWSVRRTQVLLIHNPRASRPLPWGLLGVNEWASNPARKIEGKPLHTLLGLPDGWPIADDDLDVAV